MESHQAEIQRIKPRYTFLTASPQIHHGDPPWPTLYSTRSIRLRGISGLPVSVEADEADASDVFHKISERLKNVFFLCSTKYFNTKCYAYVYIYIYV